MSLSGLCDVASDRESGCAERPITLHDGVAPGDGHVVDDPLMHVGFMDPLTQEPQFSLVCLPSLVVRLDTQGLACYIFLKRDLTDR